MYIVVILWYMLIGFFVNFAQLKNIGHHPQAMGYVYANAFLLFVVSVVAREEECVFSHVLALSVFFCKFCRS